VNALHMSYGLPRVPAHLISRPRLLEIVGRHAGLVVIQGPGGSGKTALLTQLVGVESDSSSVFWVTISGHHTSRRTFWRGVLNTMSGPTRKGVSPTTADSPTGHRRDFDGTHLDSADLDGAFIDEADGRQRLVQLVNTFPDSTLILDDLHRIDNPAIFDDLAAVLLQCRGLRILVGTRTVTPLSGPLLAARLDVVTVDAEQLKLTVQETRAMLTAAGIEQGDLASVVHDAASGLALPTRLIVVALQRNPGAPPAQISRQLSDAGAAYLDELVRLAPPDDDYVPFLFATSVAEELTTELAARLAPRSDHRSLLRRVEAGGFGTVRSGVDGDRFRYTTVVRTALRTTLRSRNPQEYRHLRRTAAEWESEFGDPYLAFVIAVDIDDLALATRIAKSAWMDLIAYHRQGIISTTETISTWRLRNYPVIAMLIALAHNSSATGRFRALEYFAIAAGSARLLRSRFAPTDQIILLTLESAALRVIGQVERSENPALHALSLLDAGTESARSELVGLLSTVYAHNGISLLYTGNFAEAVRCFELAEANSALTSDLLNRIHALSLKAGASALVGNMEYAGLVIEQAEEEAWPDQHLGGYLSTYFHIARTIARLEEFDFDAAATELDLLDHEIRTSEHRGVLLQLRAMIKLGQNERHHGARAIGAAMAAEPALRRLDARTQADLRVVAATLLTATGDYPAAAAVLDAIPVRFRGLGLVCGARLAVMTGNLGRAGELLAQVTDEERLTARGRAELDLVRASVAWRSQDFDAAATWFGDAVANLTENGLRLPLMMIPGEDLAEFRRAFDSPSLTAIFDRDVPHVFRLHREEIRLTKRESIVIGYLADDHTAREIAAALFVSVNTVKSQMQSLYKKLGVRSRDEAIQLARRLDLLPGQPGDERATDG